MKKTLIFVLCLTGMVSCASELENEDTTVVYVDECVLVTKDGLEDRHDRIKD